MSRFVDAAFFTFAAGPRPGARRPGKRCGSGLSKNMRRNTPASVLRGVWYARGGWIVLQYWFFYVFNNWRSRFFGVNDHEADWEMINFYLYEDHDGQIQPEWVAYASHDFSGDDLRRRWDDPEIEKIGEHAVIYAAAGSHASYFSRGEYLTEMELPYLSPMVRMVERVKWWWRKKLRKEWDFDGETVRGGFNVFRIPFVDYARGDGYAIGEGQPVGWDDPEMIDP